MSDRFVDRNEVTRLVGDLEEAGGGPGETFLPVANPTGVTVDTTTYDDEIKGSGKMATLVFPAGDQALFAVALAGDVFPRWVFSADPTDFGICMSNGTVSAVTFGAALAVSNGHFVVGNPLLGAGNGNVICTSGQVSPITQIDSGALPTQQLVSGAGAQIITTRDAETVTPFTGDATNNAATCKIELSPDNVTYSELNTMSIAAALNLSGALDLNVNVRVPAGWYLKLTATHGTLGLTTKY